MCGYYRQAAAHLIQCRFILPCHIAKYLRSQPSSEASAMLAEAFDLTVQCDGKHVMAVGASFTTMSRRASWKEARVAGWKVWKDGRALCPTCVRTQGRIRSVTPK